jgi:hypothetical protein
MKQRARNHEGQENSPQKPTKAQKRNCQIEKYKAKEKPKAPLKEREEKRGV